MNLRNPFKWGDVPWIWNQEQTSPEVQNRRIIGSTKTTDVLQINLKKKNFLNSWIRFKGLAESELQLQVVRICSQDWTTEFHYTTHSFWCHYFNSEIVWHNISGNRFQYFLNVLAFCHSELYQISKYRVLFNTLQEHQTIPTNATLSKVSDMVL